VSIVAPPYLTRSLKLRALDQAGIMQLFRQRLPTIPMVSEQSLWDELEMRFYGKAAEIRRMEQRSNVVGNVENMVCNTLCGARNRTLEVLFPESSGQAKIFALSHALFVRIYWLDLWEPSRIAKWKSLSEEKQRKFRARILNIWKDLKGPTERDPSQRYLELVYYFEQVLPLFRNLYGSFNQFEKKATMAAAMIIEAFCECKGATKTVRSTSGTQTFVTKMCYHMLSIDDSPSMHSHPDESRSEDPFSKRRRVSPASQLNHQTKPTCSP
jgi:hypothetical protein